MKTAKKYNPDLILHGNLIRAILSLAIPVVINSFLQTMYNLTDTYWLGKIGTEQLAAINLVTPMQNIITNFGSGITVAGEMLERRQDAAGAQAVRGGSGHFGGSGGVRREGPRTDDGVIRVRVHIGVRRKVHVEAVLL